MDQFYRPRYKKELEALAAAQLMPYACAAPAADSRQYPEQKGWRITVAPFSGTGTGSSTARLFGG